MSSHYNLEKFFTVPPYFFVEELHWLLANSKFQKQLLNAQNAQAELESSSTDCSPWTEAAGFPEEAAGIANRHVWCTRQVSPVTDQVSQWDTCRAGSHRLSFQGPGQWYLAPEKCSLKHRDSLFNSRLQLEVSGNPAESKNLSMQSGIGRREVALCLQCSSTFIRWHTACLSLPHTWKN